MDFSMWSVVAFLVPLGILLAVWGMGWLSGYKTTSIASLLTVLAGVESIDLTWLPDNITDPLIAGMGLSTVLANTVLTKRGDEE